MPPPRMQRALSRRRLLVGMSVLPALPALAACGSFADFASASPPGASTENFEVSHSEAEWRTRLSAEQFDVLREAGTEAPFSSPLDDEHRPGVFACTGCELDLFASDTKFDSGTGWPSFYQALGNAVRERSDDGLGMPRTEVFCRRCGGHLGHVFDDGPEPTGLRYCMNGVALIFRPA